MGFTAGGIGAGSAAAGIQASTGSVAAGSLFATLTSAMMGGYGVPIVFGSIGAVYAAGVTGLVLSKGRFSGDAHMAGAGDSNGNDDDDDDGDSHDGGDSKAIKKD
ncbi:hypothetical protein SLS58_007366 [Diplodia intermedia]|uniref:Uncharacterized protein n=1 Tax=Diplodia intermedia TaxID=856260 RepID=A0ABR3TK62_9PEZI